jgi:hypothetical protein
MSEGTNDWGAEYGRRLMENLEKSKERSRLLSEELQAKRKELEEEQAMHGENLLQQFEWFMKALNEYIKNEYTKKNNENCSLLKKDSDDLQAWLWDKLGVKGKDFTLPLTAVRG